MSTNANSFAGRVLDVIATIVAFLFGGHASSSGVKATPPARPRPPIGEIDVRIAINEHGFHFVHAVVDNSYVFTSTSQKGGLIPIDRSLTPLDLHGNMDQRLITAIKAMLEAHADWIENGRPQQMLSASDIERVEKKLEPSWRPNSGPKKPPLDTTMNPGDFPRSGIPLAEMRDFFLDRPTDSNSKR